MNSNGYRSIMHDWWRSRPRTQKARGCHSRHRARTKFNPFPSRTQRPAKCINSVEGTMHRRSGVRTVDRLRKEARKSGTNRSAWECGYLPAPHGLCKRNDATKGAICWTLSAHAPGLSSVRRSRQQWASSIWLFVLVGVAYFLAARLSLLLTKTRRRGRVLAGFRDRRGCPDRTGTGRALPVAAGAAVATIVANLLGDRTFMGAVVFAVCNAGEALLAGWLIQRYFGPTFSLDRLSHVLGLLGAATVAAAISGMGGTAGFLYFHSSTAPFWQRGNTGSLPTRSGSSLSHR